MRLVSIRIIISILATLFAVISIFLIDLYPNKASLIFSIEVIILPTIYIIGNYLAEHIIEINYKKNLKKYQEDIENLTDIGEKLNRKIFNQEILINNYKEEVKKLK